MTSSQSSKEKKEQKESLKETLKTIEKDYRDKVREAEKKCSSIRKEAEKVAEREIAEIKARRDKVRNEAEKEYQQFKQEARESHIEVVMDAVMNVILDIQSKNLEQHGGAFVPLTSPTFSSKSSSSSSCGRRSNSNCSSTSSMEDTEIKEWVEYAANRLESYMSKSQVRQRLLEAITTGALIRQQRIQQEAIQKTEDLERQVEELRLWQQQHQSQSDGQDIPPPAYVNAMGSTGVDASDYSSLKEKK
ncbi:hypothetical protein BGX27_007704 [Mortierella sp. AM989]|nr:hypothetical protein BGX27_007704 [Mortierella sp. AM989]